MPKPAASPVSRLSRRDILRRGVGLSPLLMLAVSDRRWVVSAQGQPLTMWGNRPEWQDPIMQLLAAFQDTHGIAVEFSTMPFPEYEPRLSVSLAAGDLPDVVGFPEGIWIRKTSATGQISAFDDPSWIADLIFAARTQVSFEGQVWGCPLAS